MDFHKRETTSEMEIYWRIFCDLIRLQILNLFRNYQMVSSAENSQKIQIATSTESTFIVVALIVVVLGFFVVALVVCALFGFFVVVGFFVGFVAFVVFLVAFVVTALIVVVEGALVVIGVVFSGALVLVLGLTVVYYEMSL